MNKQFKTRILASAIIISGAAGLLLTTPKIALASTCGPKLICLPQFICTNPTAAATACQSKVDAGCKYVSESCSYPSQAPCGIGTGVYGIFCSYTTA